MLSISSGEYSDLSKNCTCTCASTIFVLPKSRWSINIMHSRIRLRISENSLFFVLMLNMRLLYNKHWLVYVILSRQVWTAFGLVALSSGRLATQAISLYSPHVSLYDRLLTCATEPWTSSAAVSNQCVMSLLAVCSQVVRTPIICSTETGHVAQYLIVIHQLVGHSKAQLVDTHTILANCRKSFYTLYF